MARFSRPSCWRFRRLGGINLHGSILPAYRGAAPVARAIQHGETETGVTVIRITPRIDAGGMIAVARTSIGPDETAGELEHRLAVLGAPLIAQAIAAIAANTARIIPQDRSKVTRAPKLSKEDGFIDWSLPAPAIHNHVRAMQPWPLCSTTWISRDPSSKGPLRLIIHQTRPVESPRPRPARHRRRSPRRRLGRRGRSCRRPPACRPASRARSRCPPPTSSAATACCLEM